MRFKNWDGKDLKGEWLFTRKIDGVRISSEWRFPATRKTYLSRNNNELNNVSKAIDKMDFEIAEAYNGDFQDTLSILKTQKAIKKKIKKEDIYPLFPNIDTRLKLVSIKDPTAEVIKKWFDSVRKEGYEGLVLIQDNNNWAESGFNSKNMDNFGDGIDQSKIKYVKVKDKYTEDVVISGMVEGKGKHKGKLGKFLTPRGGVGTGFTDKQRKDYFKKKYIGTYIEVEAMELTPSGKFRHPRFIRLRPDK